MTESIWESKEVIAALVGVALGYLLSLGTEWWRGFFRRRAHWAALSAELEHCRSLAETYLRDGFAAPLYRLPTVAYANSLPALLAEAALNETDTRSLLTFFNEVETLNRGLDQAEGARLLADPMQQEVKLAQEFGRNKLKAVRLVPSNSGNYYDDARAVIDSHRCHKHADNLRN